MSKVEDFRVTEENTREQYRLRVLEMLKRGPCTSRELEKSKHRVQSVINELRQRGHVIETHRTRPFCTYEWKSYTPQVFVTPEMQASYYRTAHWKFIRAHRIAEADGYRCLRCGRGDNLQVHHWVYDLFEEDIDDLATYCNDCHETIHKQIAGSQVHFPRFVTPEMARRLGWSGGLD